MTKADITKLNNREKQMFNKSKIWIFDKINKIKLQRGLSRKIAYFKLKNKKGYGIIFRF